ncbi:hypothetical protein [Nonomuraea maritima]|uniref:hypothetical protein n=1 Tax=Nonomuraea maritima TaxID=683260 RepID=UPI003721E846
METETEHHHGSHRRLVTVNPETHESGAVDAIVVPTIRHPTWLKYAIRLATELDCVLVTLHSKWSKAHLVPGLVPAGVRFLSVQIADPAALNVPDFSTTALLRNTPFARATDLSAKRNLGLLLARLLGWERIVFLDDDIEVSGHEDVARAAALLDVYDAVGMHIGGYPDNSVVCHAHRLAGGKQDSFVGGGALAVHTTRNPSFFPNIYNEDWFYLLNDKELRQLAVTGMVKQRPYDPFDRPVRARDQEFGDTLAEGVYWLLDEGETWEAATGEKYWEQALSRRTEFIKDVLRRVESRLPGNQAVENSLRAALGRHNRITPQLCVQYLQAWKEDRLRWETYLDTVPPIGFDKEEIGKSLAKHGVPKMGIWASFDRMEIRRDTVVRGGM